MRISVAFEPKNRLMIRKSFGFGAQNSCCRKGLWRDRLRDEEWRALDLRHCRGGPDPPWSRACGGRR
jgi:hypothetical protein